MTSESNPTFSPVPPTMASPESIEPPPPSWPTVIGVIAIVFGSLGVLGGCYAGFSPLLIDAMADAMPGQQAATFEAMKEWSAWIVAQGVVTGLMAGLLLAGGIKLLRRRTSGVRLCKTWAMLKIPLGVAMAVLQYKMQQGPWANMVQSSPGATVPSAGTMQLFLYFIIGLSIAWAWALPAFMLIWFRRAKIKEHVAGWQSNA